MTPFVAVRCALATVVLVTSMVASACAPITDSAANAHFVENTESLSAAEIYQQVSPSVAFIETLAGTGSGLVVEIQGQKYVVTNAHVLWPYSEARVVFPNRDEYLAVPLVQTDQLVDLAILGPVDTNLPSLEIDSGNVPMTGNPVYLIGYPGEGELFPDPAISEGILSRTRVWDSLDSLRYYQTDAAGAGGQSGGVLVSRTGDIIGFSGILFAKAFVLAVSSADLAPTLNRMVVDGEADPVRGAMPQRPSRKTYRGQLDNLWDTQGFMVEAPPDSELEVKVSSDGDLGVTLFDTYADELGSADQTYEGTEVVSATVSTDGPHFVTVEQFLPGKTKFTVDSSHRLALIEDPDDARLVTLGETIEGSIDYPGDIDWYLLPLERGEEIELGVESMAIDAIVAIGRPGSDMDDYRKDDDAGRGIMGSNPLLTFRARRDGDHLVVVRSFSYEDMGGFLLTAKLKE